MCPISLYVLGVEGQGCSCRGAHRGGILARVPANKKGRLSSAKRRPIVMLTPLVVPIKPSEPRAKENERMADQFHDIADTSHKTPPYAGS
jgi:hypothetical protein